MEENGLHEPKSCKWVYSEDDGYHLHFQDTTPDIESQLPRSPESPRSLSPIPFRMDEFPVEEVEEEFERQKQIINQNGTQEVDDSIIEITDDEINQ